MSCSKTGEPIEMPFGLWTRVGSWIFVFGVGPDHPKRRVQFLGESTLPGMPDDTAAA